MQTEITLAYYDEAGRLRRVRVESKRFTIGRIPDNDLMIENSSLSRRHALIESFDDAVVQISDCGSSNGTFLNGSPVTLPVDLHDGDVINLADACDLTVEFGNAREASAGDASYAAAASPPLSHEELLRRVEAGLSAQGKTIAHKTSAPSSSGPDHAGQKVPFESQITSEGLNIYIIAPVVAVVILALVVLAAIAFKGSGAKKTERHVNTNRERGAERNNDNGSLPPLLPSPDASTTVDAPQDQASSDKLDEVERDALAVMRTISKNDDSPVLTEQNVKEIDGRIKRYNGSTALRDNLRALKARAEQLSATAKGASFRPAFLAFAALAKMDKEGSRGDPLSVAQGMLPALTKTRVVQGGELAHDILLTLIATDPSTGGAIALRDSISDLTKRRPDASPAMIRNIWFLHENQKITPQAYDLAMRFLAIGAIAQNPRRYGIEAEPLTF